jgi:ATP-binding cassette subfamily C protein
MKRESMNTLEVTQGLLKLVKPLLGIMLLAIFMGCMGNLAAAFIPVLGGYAVTYSFDGSRPYELSKLFLLIAVFAVLRGILRYIEQLSNHYIAFKLLARIRHQVFQALRQLAPAKLDGNSKGNLVAIITSDIELLEVFYAHTISPIAIAAITSLVMSGFIGHIHWVLGMIAFAAYVIVGIVIPVLNSKTGQKNGRAYREEYGRLNTVVLDNLYGVDEILQYQQIKNRLQKMSDCTRKLEKENQRLKAYENSQKIRTDIVILSAGTLMTAVSGYFAAIDKISASQAMISVIAIMSSFGPTAALSSLSNNLNQTLASATRVLNILKEEPVIREITGGENVTNGDIIARNVSFSYKEKSADQGVLNDFSVHLHENKIHGILGESGCGKSTFLKLLMRFYETNRGEITYSDINVNDINTASLRKHIAYLTQETFLFHDTIENNIKIANGGAVREEVIEAAKKASVHDFIISLPKGYDTILSELGESVSGGEKQRMGVARAFLHNSKVLLLDEPTSNIDSLNEGMILNSLNKEKEGKTIVLVSHRKSTMGISDEVTILSAEKNIKNSNRILENNESVQ